MNTFRHAYGFKVVRVSEPAPVVKCDQPALCAKYWQDVVTQQPWYDEEKEHLVALLLNTRYDVKGFSMVSVGSMNEAIAHPVQIFRAAVAASAYAIVLMHNHPSGDPSPSQADHSLTRRIKDAADILQIKVLDHVVVGKADPERLRPGLYSFKEAGVL